jgi:hypothetical protein
MVELNIVESLGWDSANHEDLQNGLEIKIHIRKVEFRVLEKFWDFL